LTSSPLLFCSDCAKKRIQELCHDSSGWAPKKKKRKVKKTQVQKQEAAAAKMGSKLAVKPSADQKTNQIARTEKLLVEQAGRLQNFE
jgi:hypothetical protein